MWANRRRRVKAGPSGIPRANLLAEYRLDEGAGQWAYNRARAATPAQVNLLSHFNQAAGWNSNSTFTQNVAADPDGGDGAARLSTSGNGYVQESVAQVATTYTLTCYVKSNTGASQDFRLSIDGGATHGTFTATTSWQRFTLTQTVTAATRNVMVRTAATNAAMDILIYGAQLEVGGAATAYLLPRLDLHLGITGAVDATDPAWANGGLHYSAATSSSGGTDTAAHTVTAVTLYALARWTDGAVTPATRETHILGEKPNSLITLMGSVGASNPWPTARHGFSTNYVEAKNVAIDDGGWHILAYSYDGTTQRLWYEGYEFVRRDRTIGAIALRSLYLGGYNPNSIGWPGDIAYALAYDTTHSAAQIMATTRAIKAKVAARGIAVAAIDKLVVVEGDSISAGWDATHGGYSWYALPNITPRPASANRAVPGSRVSTNVPAETLVNRAASVDALYDASRARNILTVMIGVNDLAADGDNGAILYGEIKAYCQARKATGWRLVIGTILPTTQTAGGGVLNTRRTDCNTLLRNAVAEGWADALADFAADATMGPLAAASNTSLYSDGTHPTALGHQTLAPIWQTAVAALL